MRAAFLFVALAVGCGGGSDSDHDAGTDAGPEIPQPTPPEPVHVDCPTGWREVAGVDGLDGMRCDPWPEEGPADCGDAEVHLPGTTGCAPIGPACPVADFAADIPADADVVYVRAGATAGGDGSLAAPFSSVVEGVAAAGDGDVVALSKGTFDESVVIDGAQTLWGACAAETILANPAPSDTEPTLEFRLTGGGGAKNVQVSGARWGIKVATRDPTRLEGVLVREVRGVGLIVSAAGSLVASDLVVRGTGPRSDGQFGTGLQVSGAAHADVSRAAFEGNHAAGILVLDEATDLALSDVVVRDTLPQQSNRELGVGLDVTAGGHATLARFVAQSNRTAGLLVDGAGTAVEATDVFVADTDTRESDGDLGYALDLYDGAQVVLERATFARNRALGALVSGEGTLLDATDWIVDETRGRAVGDFGYGVEIARGARIEVVRARFDRNHGAGVAVAGVGSQLVGTDVVVRETASLEGAGTAGFGLGAQSGAHIEIVRGALQWNHTVGVAAHGAATTVRLEDVLVEGTLQAECAPDACGDAPGGFGLGAYAQASMEAVRFLSTSNAVCGVSIASMGEIDLHDGAVTQNPIGVNLQTEGFDVARLQDGVVYAGNGTNLDASLLPVPDVIDEI